jgi:ribosomal 50S subunit-associated protein YjgA (DUF615 family)
VLQEETEKDLQYLGKTLRACDYNIIRLDIAGFKPANRCKALVVTNVGQTSSFELKYFPLL